MEIDTGSEYVRVETDSTLNPAEAKALAKGEARHSIRFWLGLAIWTSLCWTFSLWTLLIIGVHWFVYWTELSSTVTTTVGGILLGMAVAANSDMPMQVRTHYKNLTMLVDKIKAEAPARAVVTFRSWVGIWKLTIVKHYVVYGDSYSDSYKETEAHENKTV